MVESKQAGGLTLLGCSKDAPGLLQDPSTKGGKEKQAKTKQNTYLDILVVCLHVCIEVRTPERLDILAVTCLPGFPLGSLAVSVVVCPKQQLSACESKQTREFDGGSSLAGFIVGAATTHLTNF